MSCIQTSQGCYTDTTGTIAVASGPTNVATSTMLSCASNICSTTGIPTITLPSYQQPSYQTQENDKMSNCGISIDCTVPSYAWHGADFALHCIGLAVIILASAVAYEIYKRCNGKKK